MHVNKHESVATRHAHWFASKPMEISSREKTILDQIVEARRESIAHRKRVLPDVALKFAVEKVAAAARFSGSAFARRVQRDRRNEESFASRGMMREDYAPASLALNLEAAGAAALSVLTEEEFFLGSLGDLKDAKKADANSHPAERFHHRSVAGVGSTRRGRRCVSLDRRDSGRCHAARLLELGRSLKMEPLVEVHSREELARAVGAGARIIGVNNRDLRDFKVRIETSLDLVEAIPEDCIAVSESGLRTHDDLLACARGI